MDLNLSYTFAGLVVGFIVGITGVGGGSLMTPILVLGFGIHPTIAVGTDLLYASITKAGGSIAHARQGTVDWSVAGWLAAGSLPSALATTFLLRRLERFGYDLSGLINTTLGAALVLTALALLVGEWLKRSRGGKSARGALQGRGRAAATVAVGVVLGALVTISSVGAGALGAAALLFLYRDMPTVRIAGTDIVHAVPLTAVAGLGHASLGHIDYALLASLLMGSLPGIYFGSRIAAGIPERWLRPALATLLILVGGRLVW